MLYFSCLLFDQWSTLQFLLLSEFVKRLQSMLIRCLVRLSNLLENDLHTSKSDNTSRMCLLKVAATHAKGKWLHKRRFSFSPKAPHRQKGEKIRTLGDILHAAKDPKITQNILIRHRKRILVINKINVTVPMSI